MYRINAKLRGMVRRVVYYVQQRRHKLGDCDYGQEVGGWLGWISWHGYTLAFKRPDGSLFFDW